MSTFGQNLSSLQPAYQSDRITYRKIPFEKSPSQIYETIAEKSRYSFMLDSVAGPEKLTEYSFIGFDPKAVLICRRGDLRVEDGEGSGVETIRVEDPLVEVRRILSGMGPKIGFTRFAGGAVGYVSYDSVRYWERLPDTLPDRLGMPDLEMGIYDDGLIFDHRRREAYYFYLGRDRHSDVLEILRSGSDGGEFSSGEVESNVSKEEYMDAVVRAKEYIASGDIFQVVLARKLDFQVRGSLTKFYRSLLEVNPSPYMYYLKMDGRTLVGSSPEMLVRVEDGRIESFPIAGTRPRTNDERENRRLTEELLADPKDRAEHVMLVDLARNDLGRISRYGSVEVTEFMKVHHFSHVQHIVSRVQGRLREGFDCFDSLRSTFPAGTVSGAPKVRAMEIIEELEAEKRGPYAGAAGYFSFNGNSDFAIVIRTLVEERGRASIQVGAGIVAGSTPEGEWLETEAKARGLIKALEKAHKE